MTVLGRAASVAICAVGASSAALAERPSNLEDLLFQGKLDEAERFLTTEAGGDDGLDPLKTTQLGVTRLLKALERIGQANYRYGVGTNLQTQAPFFRLPVPANDQPEEVSYHDIRAHLEGVVEDLAKVESALSPVGDSTVKWVVDLARLRIDIDNNGEATEAESLGRIFQVVTRRRRRQAEPPELAFVVGIDTADVYWLRGYCHVLSAIAETILAYDQQRAFDATAQAVFPRAKVAHEYLRWRPEKRKWWGSAQAAADAVAFLHLADWPVAEAVRLRSARQHLLGMVQSSRDMWRAIDREEDNDHEWIPNSGQQSVLPGGTITEVQAEAWVRFLDEAEAVLEGELLIPYWRDPERGVNLRRVFDEPSRFDLILWIQGSAAAPYLEDGPMSERETWMGFQRVFRGNFVGFAFWIN